MIKFSRSFEECDHADKEYYHGLNDLFKTYDALLFEMVGGHTGMTRDDLSGKSGDHRAFVEHHRPFGFCNRSKNRWSGDLPSRC